MKKEYSIQKEYKIHFNGGYPFLVTLFNDDKKVAHIYHYEYDDKDDEYKKNEHAHLTLYPLKTFVGKSPVTEMTKYSHASGPFYDGNSMLFLIHREENVYIFVGLESVFEFKALSPIQKFYSPVGNNQVPYPYAVDDQNRVYLLIENVILTQYPFENPKKNEPYEDGYYKMNGIEGKNFQGITEYFVNGNQRAMLDYQPFPKRKPYSSQIVQNGKIRDFSFEDQKKLFEEFGKVQGFIPLKTKILMSAAEI